jgi:hypothetical protein
MNEKKAVPWICTGAEASGEWHNVAHFLAIAWTFVHDAQVRAPPAEVPPV